MLPLPTGRATDRLPAALLAPTTEVEVVYESEYDRGGDGFHHFVDPEDGAEYTYTNFEPFEAHRLFPCFDQPDLKGTYALTVRAPAEWAVIANAPVAAATPIAGDRREHRFAATPPISTYLVALIAGPYTGVRALHRGTPLGIWTRRSLARFLDADEVFAVTKQGLDYYAALFDHPFPFAKYDQIFVPEFNSGAMENVGAVTFSESYVFRDPPTDTQRLARAETVLHELAHMWFGDLATMRWWDDLWLNESFATYVSNLCLAEATRFAGAWRAFHADMKRWGYQADARSTTHPISGLVPDTDATFYNFDGITYGKGASVIKQLVAEIGHDAFRAGLRTYFRRHAWGNATLADFLAALEDGAGRSLGEWSRRWLETASLNTIQASWTERDGLVERLQLSQRRPAEDHPPSAPTPSSWPSSGPAATAGGGRRRARPDRGRGGLGGGGGRAARSRARLPQPRRPRVRQGSSWIAPPWTRPPGAVADRRPAPAQLIWGDALGDGSWARYSALEFLGLVRTRLPEERDDQIVLAGLDAARGALSRYVPRSAGWARPAASLTLPSRPCRRSRRETCGRSAAAAIGAAADPADAARLALAVDGEAACLRSRWTA